MMSMKEDLLAQVKESIELSGKHYWESDGAESQGCYIDFVTAQALGHSVELLLEHDTEGHEEAAQLIVWLMDKLALQELGKLLVKES